MRHSIRLKSFLLSSAALVATFASLTACVPEDVNGPTEPGVKVDLDAINAPVAAEFSSEQSLKERYSNVILKAYNEGEDGSFSGYKGVKIHYHINEVPNPRGVVVLLPGRTEPVLKYAEVIRDLMAQHYSVYALDHRGQGDSGRMTSNQQKGYVEYFSHYVSDIETFVDTVVKVRASAPLMLLAHSMGGGAATLYLSKHPLVFKAAALSAPMIEINTGAFPEFAAYSITGGICSRGAGDSYGIGQGDFNDDLKFTDVDNDVTQSEPRFDVKMQMYVDHPELKIGGATNQWICDSILATAKMRKLKTAGQTPVLLMQAGDDKIVNLSGQNQYCNQVSTCQSILFPGSYHEILMERDSIRNEAMAKVVRYFNFFSGK